jgi:lysophospholipid acyltransferase (LPLAT)-like uncharacterized protein
VTRSELAYRVVALGGGGFLRVLGATLRLQVRGAEAFQQFRRQGRPVIFTFWHSWILPLAYLHRNQGAVVLVSRHADGEYIARVVEGLGFRTARGSSTRGGVQGLRELVRHLREGRDAAITPDGPRGPARRFKAGALVLARLTGAPVIPVGVRPGRCWRVNSWDRFVVPEPFARVQVEYGEPHFIPRDAGEEALNAHARELEEILNRLSGSGDDGGAPRGQDEGPGDRSATGEPG